MESEYFIPVKIITDESVVKETLQRIGIPNKKDKVLYQTCHLIEKDDFFCIIHFKEYFGINNDNLNMIKMNEEDFKRRNTIIHLLHKWKLIELNEEQLGYFNDKHSEQRMFVLNYHDKMSWDLRMKVNLADNKEMENEIA